MFDTRPVRPANERPGLAVNESVKVDAPLIDEIEEPRQISRSKQALNGFLPPPDMDISTVAKNGEDAWYYLRDRYLRTDPPKVPEMKQLLACAEAGVDKVEDEPDELEFPMACVYLDLAQESQSECPVFLDRVIELARRVPGRDGDVRNVERWAFIRLINRAFSIDREKKILGRSCFDLDVYYDVARYCCHLLRLDNSKKDLRDAFEEIVSFAETSEAKTKLVAAICDSLAEPYVSMMLRQTSPSV